MSLAAAFLPTTPSVQARRPKTRVLRPFPREVADVVGVEDHGAHLQLRMHPWFAIILVRSPAVVTVESRRDVIAHSNSVVLIPPFHLYGLRALGDGGHGPVTLLLTGTDLEERGLPGQAALVTDAALGEQMAGLMARLLAPLTSVEHAPATQLLVRRLLSVASPLAPNRAQQHGPLDAVRTYLKTNVSQLVSTWDVARMSALSQGQVIRAFHYAFGLPPHAYHMRVRLAAACKLLTEGVAIARVAHECGFADQSHLSRRFKSVYGVTPAMWAAGSAGGRGGAPAYPRAGSWRHRSESRVGSPHGIGMASTVKSYRCNIPM